MKKSLSISMLSSIALLTACGGGGGGGGSSLLNTLDVTVATGAPVIGAKVTVVDSTGASEDCAGTTSDAGKLTCSLSLAKTPPYFIRAQQKNFELFAVLPDSSSSVNVTPISNVMARKFLVENNLEPQGVMANPESMKTTTKLSAQTAVDVVNEVVKVVAQQTAGITIQNALTQPYSPTSSSDTLDKIILNVGIKADSTGVNLTIPTNSGAVSFSVDYSKTKDQAISVATTSTSSVTANLSDTDEIYAVFSQFLSNLNSCSTQSKQAMVAAMDGDYMSGQTVSDWITRACNTKLPKFKLLLTNSLARFDNKSINAASIQTENGDVADLTFSFKKVANQWKLMADNMPVDMSLKTRHALTYMSDDSLAGKQQTKMQFERYVDTWVNQEADRQIASALPQKIEIYAIDLKSAGSKWKSSNFPTVPDIVVTRNANCSNNWYSAYANKCSSFALDSDYASLFSRLENADYTLVVFKLKDGANNCMNCDVNGVPKSGSLLGKAYTIQQIFGSGLTADQLKAGVPYADVPSTFETNARVYYAMPSTAQLTQLSGNMMSKNLTNTISVAWQRATGKKQQVDSIWGGVNSCVSNSAWRELNKPDDTFKLPSDKWDFVYDSQNSNKTFNSASWISLTIANRVNESEFAFYLNANRNTNCIP